MDLAEFLRARLDEREMVSRHAGEGRIAWLTYLLGNGELSRTTVAADHHDGYWCAGGKLLPEPASVLIVYDQAEALRDVAAKRAILVAHSPSDGLENWCKTCDADFGFYPCPTVRQLGTEFADHDGYRQEWVPRGD